MQQVRAKKSLGQHFLRDLSIAERIAQTIGTGPVLEIGPGMGVLTQFLLRNPQIELTAVELDHESVVYLTTLQGQSRRVGKSTLLGDSPLHTLQGQSRRVGKSTIQGQSRRVGKSTIQGQSRRVGKSTLLGDSPRMVVETPWEKLRLIEGDFLKMDLSELYPSGEFRVIGNYPYNISSQIFFRVLEHKDRIPVCSGMIQREVALRLAAKPGCKDYGILSVLMQTWYDIEYLFTVDEHVFCPPPKVKSAVVRFTRNHRERLDCDERLFVTVVKTAFNQRRKQMRNSLKTIYSDASEVFNLRPEQLSVDQFINLTKLIQDHVGNQNIL